LLLEGLNASEHVEQLGGRRCVGVAQLLRQRVTLRRKLG
jgi:hypothetical protein